MANRFDELLPIQPILQQSLYTPFRMKDNTDLYTKLLSTLPTKKDKTIKPESVPVVKRNDSLLPVQFDTNPTVLFGSNDKDGINMSFNVNYADLYNYIDEQYYNALNAEQKKLFNYLTSDDYDSDKATLGAIQLKQLTHLYEHNPDLGKIKKAQESYAKVTQNLTSNDEKNSRNYKALEKAGLLANSGILAPETSSSSPIEKTFSEIVTESLSKVRNYEITRESELQLLRQILTNKYLTQIFQTETTTAGGTSLNPYVKEIGSLDAITNAATNLYNLNYMKILKNINSSRGINPNQLNYNNLYQLHLILEDKDLFTGADFSIAEKNLGLDRNKVLQDRENIILKNNEVLKKIEEDKMNSEIKIEKGNIKFEGTFKDLINAYGNVVKKYNEAKNNKDETKLKQYENELVTYLNEINKFEYNYSSNMMSKVKEITDPLERDLYIYNLAKQRAEHDTNAQIEKELKLQTGLYTSKEDKFTRDPLVTTINLGVTSSDRNGGGGDRTSENKLYFTSGQASVGEGKFEEVLNVTGVPNKLQDGTNAIDAIFGKSINYNDEFFGGKDKNSITYSLNSKVAIENDTPVLIITAINKSVEGLKKIEKKIPYKVDEKGIPFSIGNEGEFEAWNRILSESHGSTQGLVDQFKGKMSAVGMLANNEKFMNMSNGINAPTIDEKIAKTLFTKKNYDIFGQNMNITVTLMDKDGNSLLIDERMLKGDTFFSPKLEAFLDKYIAEKYKIIYNIKDKDNNDIIKISGDINKNKIMKKTKNSITGDVYKTYYFDVFNLDKIFEKINEAQITTNLRNANTFFNEYGK